ncbi:MAG: O-antigen ligase family protein, partial [Elusimicrobiaceae bacterium]|nr:O-antigen ligase family protein [Elusimicrobiaceae bacterium]
KKVYRITILIITFFVLVYLIVTYSASIGLRQFGTGSDNARLGLYSAAINMLKDFPYTGVGFDSFSTAIDAYIPFALKQFPRYLHNDWLELLLSFGYIAGTVILWLIFVIIFDITRLFKELDRKKQIRLFVLCAGLSGFTFTGLVDFPFHLPACALLFFITLALVSTSTFTSKAEEVRVPVTLKIILIFTSCFLLWQNFNYVKAWRNFIFVRQFTPRIQARELSKSLDYYPSPKYVRHVLVGKYKMLKSKDITEAERELIKQDIHYLAGVYLKQYPKDNTLSRFFILTK